MSTDRFTEILNYLSAMRREIGEFRAETNRRLDALETRMGSLEKEVRLIREDMRLLWHTTDIVTQDLMEVRTRQRSHSARLESLEAK